MPSEIELIKILRNKTNANLKDCKKALEINNNDIEASIKWMRSNGIISKVIIDLD